MTLKQKIGVKWKGLLNILGFFVLVAIVVASVQRRAHSSIQNVIVTVDDYQERSLLSPRDVKNILIENFDNSLINTAVTALDLELIEAIISEEEMVNEVEVYLDKNNDLHVDVWTKEPQFRVFTGGGQSVYVDPKGNVFPTSRRHSVRVPIVSGDLNWITLDEDERKEALLDLMAYICKEPFYNALTDQIYIDEKGSVELSPRLHEVAINLGSLGEASRNLKKLKPFYKHTVHSLGLHRYEKIDLSYRDQVICTLRENRT